MTALLAGLKADELRQVRTATGELLAGTGFRVAHQGLRERCRQAGAIVEDQREIVRFPPDFLRELLAQAPAEYTVTGANGQEWRIGGEEQHCLAIVTDPWIIDYETRRPRRPCLEDLRRHTIIAQRLSEVFAVSRMDFPVTDVDGPHSSLRALHEHLKFHHKHIYVLAATERSFRQWLEIGEVLGGAGYHPAQGRIVSGPPIFTVGVAVISPLTLSDLNARLLLEACAHGFPVVPTTCPQAGTTSPYSLAGTLLQANVENIGLAALAQIVNPGNPFLYAVGPSVADMRSGHDRYYTLDKVLWKHAGVQLAQAYGLPSAAECGGTMTDRYDQQSGAEGMLFMLAAYGAGANILAGIGSCYNAVGMSAEMMVIQTAWLQAARFLSRGIRFDAFEDAVGSIRAQGPGGNYLADDLTLANLRSGEFFASDLFDLSGYVEDGPCLLKRAHQRVEDLIDGYESQVPAKALEDLDEWMRRQM